MNIRIYQINMGRDEKRVAFMGFDEREHLLDSSDIDSSIYDCVFSGNVECEGLEEVFQMFNTEHPNSYAGRSLSVSDVVEVIDADNVEKGFYYCDNIGFSKIDFDPEEAEPIFINADKKTCLKRLASDDKRTAEQKAQWAEYINDWFESYTE